MLDMRSQLLGNKTVRELVDFGVRRLPGSDGFLDEFYTGTVKPFGDIVRLHEKLIDLKFQMHQVGAWGPAGGQQFFYVQDTTCMDRDKWVFDGILVRIKTKGNRRPPRKDTPHLSVSLYESGLEWEDEKKKFAVDDKVTDKSAPGSMTEEEKDAWAHSCHFNFPPGFDFSQAFTLIPGNYALREAFWKAAKS